MSAPQIIMIIVSVILFFKGLIVMAIRADRDSVESGGVIIAVLLWVLWAVMYQLLLWWGGFYG